MVKSWFNAAQAKTFGLEMATLIAHRTPVEPVDNNQVRLLKKYDKRYEVTLALIEKRLEAFKKNNKLNIYTKAQLGSAFKNGLIDKGYDLEFSEKRSRSFC